MKKWEGAKEPIIPGEENEVCNMSKAGNASMCLKTRENYNVTGAE